MRSSLLAQYPALHMKHLQMHVTTYVTIAPARGTRCLLPVGTGGYPSAATHSRALASCSVLSQNASDPLQRAASKLLWCLMYVPGA